jgi:dual specificity protein kinase YAK1
VGLQCSHPQLKRYLDEGDLPFISQIDAHFITMNHYFIVMELLGATLYDELLVQNFRSMSFRDIHEVLCCALPVLDSMAAFNMVHCDVKPENILRSPGGGFKLIDFGSSLFIADDMVDYVQSRHYRAPEIVLKLPYNSKADIWSLGCVIAEMKMGLPLFPAQSHIHLLSLINQTVGPFPRSYAQLATGFASLFTPGGLLKSPEVLCSENGEDFVTSFRPLFGGVTLKQIIMGAPKGDDRLDTIRMRQLLIDLIESMLKIDPAERISAEEALEHPFMQIDFTAG